MARTGRFGRLPRAAPDLTSTIMSMVEQYEGARDRNIIDAWQNGGTFEGKPVTDAMLLAHFDQRIKEISPDDPMHDYWVNTKWQYRFTIAEQKTSLAYERGNIGEAAVAGFYRAWAEKLPRQSAAWRDMMSSAAKFAKAVSAGSSASAAQARYDAAMRSITNINERRVQPAANAIGYLNNVAVMSGLTSIDSFNLTDAADFEQILALTADDPMYGPLLIDAYDKAFPGKQTGSLSIKQLESLLGRGLEGTKDQLGIAKKNGISTTGIETIASTLKQGRSTLRTYTKNVWGTYESLSEELMAALDSDVIAGDPGAQAALMQQHGEALLKLSDKMRMSDPARAGSLFREAHAWLGDIEGTKGPNTPGQDASSLATDFQANDSGPQSAAPSDSQQADARDAALTGEDVGASYSGLIAIHNSRLLADEMAVGLADGSIVLAYDPSRPGTESQKYRPIPSDSIPPGGKLVTVKTPSRVYTDPKTGKTKTIPGGASGRVALPIPIYITVGDVNRADDPTAVSAQKVLAGYEYPYGAGDANTIYSVTVNGREMFTTIKPWSGGASENTVIDGVRYIRYSTASARTNDALLLTNDADGHPMFISSKLLNPESIKGVDMTDVVRNQPVAAKGADPTSASGGNPQVGPDGKVIYGPVNEPVDKTNTDIVGNMSAGDLTWMEGVTTLWGSSRKDGESNGQFLKRAFTTKDPRTGKSPQENSEFIPPNNTEGLTKDEVRKRFWDASVREARKSDGSAVVIPSDKMVGFDPKGTPAGLPGATTPSGPVSTVSLIYPKQTNVSMWSTAQTAIIATTADRMWSFGEGKGDFPSPVETFKWNMENDESFANDLSLQQRFWDEARVMMNNAAKTKDTSQAAAYMALFQTGAGSSNQWYAGSAIKTADNAARQTQDPVRGDVTLDGMTLRDRVANFLRVVDTGAAPLVEDPKGNTGNVGNRQGSLSIPSIGDKPWLHPSSRVMGPYLPPVTPSDGGMAVQGSDPTPVSPTPDVGGYSWEGPPGPGEGGIVPKRPFVQPTGPTLTQQAVEGGMAFKPKPPKAPEPKPLTGKQRDGIYIPSIKTPSVTVPTSSIEPDTGTNIAPWLIR